ncbi:FHA domain-containing protein [Actinomadura geliboluensis]|uniref:FHA domain-containing protein n=1 Tax=Actinomadura geliboluensis TaxID=882440 RepID=UPI003717CF1E
MATLNCPVCGEPHQQGDLLCMNCGANLARGGGGAHRQGPGGYDDQQPQGGQYGGGPQHGQPQYGAPQPHDPYGQQSPQHQPGPPPGQQPDQWGPPQPPQPDQWGPPPGQQQSPGQYGQPQHGAPQQGGPHQGGPPHGGQAPGQQPADPWGMPQQPQQPQDQWGAPQPPSDQYQQQREPQYQPPQDQYGAPQGQYGAPQQDQYGASQPDQYGAPQQDQYGAPQDQYGAPQDQYGGAPQQDQYGAPQPADHQFGPPPQPHGQPPLGGPQHGGPPHGGPQHGGPQHGGPQHGGQPPLPPHGREATLLPHDQGQRPPAPDSTAFMCPYCEAVLSNPGAAQCDSCLRPLPKQGTPVLRVQFPTGELKVSVGQHLVLGRDAGQSPVAATFTQYDNVSRRHSTVWLDPSGTAWVRDEGSTNGTFVNGERLPRGVEAPLRDGDQLRLAADVTGTVQLK